MGIDWKYYLCYRTQRYLRVDVWQVGLACKRRPSPSL